MLGQTRTQAGHPEHGDIRRGIPAEQLSRRRFSLLTSPDIFLSFEDMVAVTTRPRSDQRTPLPANLQRPSKRTIAAEAAATAAAQPNPPL
jgi:hypothetical protein